MENPKCPYCGEEMELNWVGDWHWYTCPHCFSESPNAKGAKAAYAAAMKRAECENVRTDYYCSETDQFVCSECGIHLEDWVQIDVDTIQAGVVDGIVDGFAFNYCPNCGKKVRKK